MATIIRVPAPRPARPSVSPKLHKVPVGYNPVPVTLPPGYIGSAGSNANPSTPPPRTAHDNLSRAPLGHHGHRPFVEQPAAVIPPPPPPVKPPFDYANAYITDPRYTKGVAAIAADQAGYGASYGLIINRDTTVGSPTFGMALFRPKGSTSGSGNITAKIDPVTGLSTYSDPSGKTYTAAEIEMDIMQIARGQAGYLKGSLGNTQEQSNNNQFAIADAAAQAGAGKSGMRVTKASEELYNLQNALSKLTAGYGSDLAGTTIKYQDLLNTIQPTVLESATAYGTPAPDAPADAPAAPAAPVAPVARSLTSGPKGEFAAVINGLMNPTHDMDPKVRLRELKNLYTHYALTPKQKKYVDDLIKKLTPK